MASAAGIMMALCNLSWIVVAAPIVYFIMFFATFWVTDDFPSFIFNLFFIEILFRGIVSIPQ